MQSRHPVFVSVKQVKESHGHKFPIRDKGHIINTSLSKGNRCVTVYLQVTQHQIWTPTLEEILNGLKYELDYMNGQFPRHTTKMGGHIFSVCLEFLNETSSSFHPNSSAWMCVSPAVKADSSTSRKWEDVLQMFDDLIRCL